MHADWDLQDRHRWDDFTEQGLGGLHQSWSYGQAMQAFRVPCLRVALKRDAGPQSEWIGAAQLIVHRLPWFARFAFALGGPIWAPGTDVDEQQKALKVLRETVPLRRPRFAFFTPPIDTRQTPAAPHAFGQRMRVATGGSTVLLDLTRSPQERRAAQEGRWRNRLNAAERSGLKMRVCGSKTSDYEWLVKAEGAQRQKRGYIALPEHFVQAFQAASRKPSAAVLTLAAQWEKQPCAGMLFLVHGSTATYHLGWTNDTGREHSAHNLLLWEACSLLAERGVRQLDLGGVDTLSNPGLARFKIGSGGRVVTWAGTYL